MTAKAVKRPSQSFSELYAKWLNEDQYDADLAFWLKANDKLMYGDRMKIKQVKQRYELHSGKQFTYRLFRFHVCRFCEFWLNDNWRGMASPTRATALSEQAWERLHRFLRAMWSSDNKQFDIKGDDVTINFIVRICRLAGVPASRDILANCSVFKTLTKGRDIR